ncbi:Janus kinase and microtubule-interacting protein [Dirofilaria immitis]
MDKAITWIIVIYSIEVGKANHHCFIFAELEILIVGQRKLLFRPSKKHQMASTCSSPSSSGYGTLSKNNTVRNVQKQQNSVFGSSTMMNKEDYERDRIRWQQKLDDTSKRLADAEIINSEMNQIKAELNKKIVEMERIQRPLIEQNRRLTERNRILQNEMKNCEQKLCHSQDDFLTLKDDYERLVKDNQNLKERRAFPEKLEELDRYRNQVLEYSKCITALRQTGLEKDRRYDLLVQKFKRLRKCISSRKNGESEEDRQSLFGGSDCSAESSISLNTITEDLNETLDKDIENGYQQIAHEGEQLRRTLSALKTGEYELEDDQLLRNQLICAQTTIAQQQVIIEQQQLQSENTMELLDSIARLQDQLMEQRSKMESMEAELIESKEMNELLEFQILENKENMEHEFEKRQTLKESVSKDTMTDSWINEDDECTFLSQMSPLPDFGDICNRKCDLINLRRSASLNMKQRELIQHVLTYIEYLEDQLLHLKIDTEQKICQFVLKETENATKIQNLEEQIEQSYSEQKKKDHLQMELEELRKREIELDSEKQMLNDEVNRMSKEMGKLRYVLQQKDEQLALQNDKDSEQESLIAKLKTQIQCCTDENNELRSQLRKCTESLQQLEEILTKKEEEMKLLEKENDRLQLQYSNALDEIQRLRDDIRPAVKTDLERRFEEYRYRLSCALKTVHEYEDEISKLRSQMAKFESKSQEKNGDTVMELEQIREYSEQLEEQFTAQVGIIEALKRKIVQQKTLTDFLWSITESDELNFAKVEDKLARFRSSQQDEANCQLTDAVQTLLRLVSTNCAYSYKTLSSTPT